MRGSLSSGERQSVQEGEKGQSEGGKDVPIRRAGMNWLIATRRKYKL